MKTLGIMCHTSKEEYLEICCERYSSRNRVGRSVIIDKVSDTVGWDREHFIEAFNMQVTHGKKGKRR
jgi:hypothetical protein